MNKAITYSRFLILCQYPICCSGPRLALFKRKAVSYGGFQHPMGVIFGHP